MALLLDKLSHLLNIHQGEGRLVLLLFGFSFSLGFAVVFYETTAFSLFLTHYNVEQMPYVYMGAAILIMLFGTLYARLEERINFDHLLLLTISLLIVGITLLLLYKQLDSGTMPALVIALCSDMIAMLTGLVFWSLSGRLLNIRQAKRLFSLVSTGEVVAGIIGGLLVPILIPLFGTSKLLLVVVFSFAFCLALLNHIVRDFPDAMRVDNAMISEDEDRELAENERIGDFTWHNPYLLMIGALASLSLIGYYFVDYLFYSLAEERYPSEEELASFLGLFFAFIGVVNLLFKSVLSGRLLNTHGMTLGLLFLPVMVGLSGLAAIASGWFDETVLMLFWFVAGIKLIDAVSRVAIDEPSVVILYQPLPVGYRMRAQTLIESIGEPVAALFGGGGLLLLGQHWELSPPIMLVMILAVVTLWITVGLVLRRDYWQMLGNALSKRTLGEGIHLTHDASSLSILSEHLKSDHVGEVIYVLNVLEEAQHSSLADVLPQMLSHQAIEVRIDALHRIERLGMTSAEPDVKRLLYNHMESTQLRGTALRTLAAIGSGDIIEEIIPYLSSGEAELRRGAMVALLRSGGIDGILAAGEYFYHLVRSNRAPDRQLAADVLGEVGVKNFYRPLLMLFRDPALEVRRTSLIAAGRLQNPRLWPEVIEALSRGNLRRDAEIALLLGGESVVPELRRAFFNNKGNIDIQLRIARICGHHCTEAATSFMLDALKATNQQVRMQILRSLVRCHYHPQERELRQRLHLEMLRETQYAAWILHNKLDLAKRPIYPLLTAALDEKLHQLLERLFQLLMLFYGVRRVKQLQANYFSPQADKRAYAIEMLDGLLERRHKSHLLPLLDDIPDDQRVEMLNDLFPYNALAPEQRIADIIVNPSETISFWSRCCALYEVGQHNERRLYPAVVTALRSPNNYIRETALWTLAQLRPHTLHERISPLMADPAVNVARVAHYIHRTTPGTTGT